MSSYPDPLGGPNPFLRDPPIVFALRHVPVTTAGDTVVEGANALPRYWARIDGHRLYPRSPLNIAPVARDIPDAGEKKKQF